MVTAKHKKKSYDTMTTSTNDDYTIQTLIAASSSMHIT
jgi:hypothetical protein